MRRRLCSARRSRPPNTSSDAVVAGDPAHGLRRLDRTAAREHAEAREQPPVLRSSRSWLQSMAPRSVRWRSGRSRPPADSRPSRSPRRWAIAAGDRSRIRAAASSIASGRPSSRRTISATCVPFSAVSAEVGPDGHRSLDEQAHRLRLQERFRPSVDTRRGQRQRRDRELLLAGDPQRGPARHDDRQLWRRPQQVGDDRGARDDLLEVVEHQQRGAVLEVVLHAIDGRPLRGEQPDGRGDRRRHEVRIGHRRERHEPRAVGVPVDAVARERQRQPRLARAAGAGERQQPRPVQQRHRAVDLGPPDERRQLGRQVVGREIERLERGKRGLQTVGLDLVQPLRAREVLEPVLAEVEQGDPGADLARDDARRIREDDLAAVGRRRDARRAVHLDAHVVARDDQDLAGVDAHAHPDVTAFPRVGGEGLLGGDGRADGPGGRREGDEDRVALGSERHAALCGGGPGHDVPVRAERLAVGRVADVGEQARRALDVREQEGDDAFGQRPGHAGSRSVVRSSNSISPRA